MPYTYPVNFIAHIHLSGARPGVMVGNFIADLIAPKDFENFPSDIQKGVLLHRHIDSFTDNHESNRQVLEIMYPRHRKYARVLLDIYYDYFLIRHWSAYSSVDFIETCDWTYTQLRKYLTLLPHEANEYVMNLLNRRWLAHAYSDIEGLERTFYYLKKRTSRPEYIEGASNTLLKNHAEIDNTFLTFYPQVIESTRRFEDNLSLEVQ